MPRFVLGTAALVFCLCGALAGQETSTSNIPTAEPSTPTVSVDVKVVNVLATVRDKHGKIISNLEKGDFILEEDTHPITIHYFSRESDLSLTLGLLVDTSMSQRAVIDQERSASKTFLERVLREKDSAFLIHFDREVELLQDLTSSKQELESELDSLQTRSRFDREDSSGPNSPDLPDNNPQRGGGRGMRRTTQLYDAIYLASDELLRKQQGRKAVVVLSDGVDRGSKESLEGAIEAAQKSDTVIFSVLSKGEEQFSDHHSFGYPGIGGHRGGGGKRFPEEQLPDGKKILERVSKETGGRMFEISKKQSIEQIYSNVAEELRNQYSFGFTPDKADNVGYHKIVLKTKQKDAEVQTREGFYIEQ
jgi:VWFA-related protein